MADEDIMMRSALMPETYKRYCRIHTNFDDRDLVESGKRIP